MCHVNAPIAAGKKIKAEENEQDLAICLKKNVLILINANQGKMLKNADIY